MNSRNGHARNLRPHLAVLCCALFLALAARTIAQKPQTPIAITLDPSTTAVHWTLNTTIHTVHGTFRLKNGAFKIDPATGDASGLIVVDATSGESGDSSRATHVDGNIDLAASGPVIVHGILNLHGQDHPLQITVNLHPQSSAVALATHFTVPFVAWGLKDPSTFVFRTDKQVILDVDATIVPR